MYHIVTLDLKVG